METSPKKPKRSVVDVLLFLVVIICAALILLDLYIKVQNELQGALVQFLV